VQEELNDIPGGIGGRGSDDEDEGGDDDRTLLPKSGRDMVIL